jgi:sugar/nucleoside kinase (ribokinase family)
LQLDIIGVGSALVDATVVVEDSFLEAEQLPKGGMTLVEADRSSALLASLADRPVSYCPGGAAANVMTAFAMCGGASGFIGKIGRDAAGAVFSKKTRESGVHFFELLTESINTGLVLSLVTPDGQRTFATHLGASTEMQTSEITEAVLDSAPLLFLEGYLSFNRPLFLHILRLGKSLGKKIAMDLASFTVVEGQQDFFRDILAEYIDIVFANEEESEAFSGLSGEAGLEPLSACCPLAVVKEGGKGSFIQHGDERIQIDAFGVTPKDTNGAGDAYAGGLLYGFSKGCSMEQCGKLASKAGALVVSQVGARLESIGRAELKSYVDQVVT